MLVTTLAWAALVSAAIPAAMFLRNLGRFLPPPEVPIRELTHSADDSGDTTDQRQAVSLLIPARDEAAGIAASVAAALASRGVEIEVVVLDDHSVDATAAIVDEIAARDRRVRRIAGEALPEGWNGKQFACYQLAAAARYDRFAFIDADVRLQPDALVRLVAYQDTVDVALLSAFPKQLTGSWLECWLIPLMHFILLGFLPIDRMRASRLPAYAAGCGQLFLTRRPDYDAAGTHRAIRGSRHDGLKLPAAYRAAGLATDVVDGTPIASCRMYQRAGEVIRGLLKNATEGIASPRLIIPFTTILLGGACLPWITLLAAVGTAQWLAAVIATLAIAISYLPRALAAARFDQSWLGVVFHPAALTLFVALQWIALVNRSLGRQVAWRGRTE